MPSLSSIDRFLDDIENLLVFVAGPEQLNTSAAPPMDGMPADPAQVMSMLDEVLVFLPPELCQTASFDFRPRS
jgi:hypothetical protein